MMSTYLMVKTFHILSSVLLVGTGFGSAFYLFFANRAKRAEPIALVARLVVRADWWFTTPTIILMPITGLWLADHAGWGWHTPWIAWSLVLYALAGACWLPVVWLQIRMAGMAEESAEHGRNLPGRYWRDARRWEWLGYPAFAAMLAVYFLMVVKPGLE